MEAFTGSGSFLEVDDYSDDFVEDEDYNIAGYEFVKKLGAGASGTVVQLQKDGVQYAAKVCNVRKGHLSFLERESHDPKQEAAMLIKLANPNVVKVHQLIEDTDNDRIFIIMELLTGGTIDNCKTDSAKRRAFGQVLEGVQYIHRQRLAHRDIKTDNVMLTANGEVAKLCDFGISVCVPAGNDMIQVEMKGTPLYQAPEMFTSAEYNPFKADIWALGVMLYNLMFKKFPFQAANVFQLSELIQRAEPEYPKSADKHLVALLKGMLKKDPAKRMTIEKIFQNEWMASWRPKFASMLMSLHNICETIAASDVQSSVQRISRGKVAHMKARDQVKQGLAMMFRACQTKV